jgi:hypothetical protein
MFVSERFAEFSAELNKISLLKLSTLTIGSMVIIEEGTGRHRGQVKQILSTTQMLIHYVDCGLEKVSKNICILY